MRLYAFTARVLPTASDVDAEFARRAILAEVTSDGDSLRVEADAPLIVAHEIARKFGCYVGRCEPTVQPKIRKVPRTVKAKTLDLSALKAKFSK